MARKIFKNAAGTAKIISLAVAVASVAAIAVVPSLSYGAGRSSTGAASVTPYVASEPAIMVPGGQMAGRIYVLADGTITSEMPVSQLTQQTEDRLSNAGAGRTVTASITVLPSRTIKVNGTGQIIEISSNAKVSTFGFFVLTVLQAGTGTPIPLTQAIATQYNEIRGQIDWSLAGRLMTNGSRAGDPD